MSSRPLPVERSFYSVIRCHLVYKFLLTPATGELLSVEKEEGNPHDRFAVAVAKSEEIVGHTPREVSRAFYAFLSHGGTLTCKVTGHRQHGNGLEVLCIHATRKAKADLKINKIPAKAWEAMFAVKCTRAVYRESCNILINHVTLCTPSCVQSNLCTRTVSSSLEFCTRVLYLSAQKVLGS